MNRLWAWIGKHFDRTVSIISLIGVGTVATIAKLLTTKYAWASFMLLGAALAMAFAVALVRLRGVPRWLARDEPAPVPTEAELDLSYRVSPGSPLLLGRFPVRWELSEGEPREIRLHCRVCGSQLLLGRGEANKWTTMECRCGFEGEVGERHERLARLISMAAHNAVADHRERHKKPDRAV